MIGRDNFHKDHLGGLTVGPQGRFMLCDKVDVNRNQYKSHKDQREP